MSFGEADSFWAAARVLLRRGWIIIAIAIVGALGALLFSRVQTPIYRSTITLGARPARPADYGSSLAIKNLIRFYAQQLQTKTLAQKVVDQLQLDIPPEKLLSEVSVSPKEEDLTILVEVKDPSLDQVTPIAQTLAATFIVDHQQENLQIDQSDRILVNLLDNATPPEKFSPKTTINVLAGSILGALIGALVIFALEYMQSAYIRTTDDIERSLKLTVLGAIPTMNGKQVAAPNSSARRWFWQRA